jgi:alpha-beta hydrolase superfamily lysophospholipase
MASKLCTWLVRAIAACAAVTTFASYAASALATNLAVADLTAAPSAAAGAAVAAVPSARLPHPRGTLLAGPSLVKIDIITSTVDKLEPSLLRSLLKRREGLLAVTGEPRCAIAVHSLRYQTVGGQGEATDAGAVVMLPSGADPYCSGPRPVMLYAHGTVLDKSFSMARLTGEARLIASMFVAQGYIVVAPDYAGYGASSLSYHPYLNAEQQANDMVDALRAARAAFAVLGVTPAPQLFLTGYSQGGFVALATQRRIQRHRRGRAVRPVRAGADGRRHFQRPSQHRRDRLSAAADHVRPALRRRAVRLTGRPVRSALRQRHRVAAAR